MTADNGRLEKHLGLVDVYAICTGAMFASGFFLLPGIAAANTGSSVVLAYLVSSVLMVPALLSIAELSSAMPRAAGTYFFIHRSLGPMAGTIGGIGAWAVLVAKSAFALVGMGAYLSLFVDLPVEPLAVAFTVGFAVLNVVGAKETARLQVWLVVVLVSIMAFFVAQGAVDVLRGADTVQGGDLAFVSDGIQGFVATIGLVFVSYAGLTKVSSAAEEVRDLDRNLPLGMVLSLLTVGVIYTLGVWILVLVLPADTLADDLTPVATAGEALFGWLPGPVGIGVAVLAAVTAFASTGNAGILTASRFPLAMARDRLLWGGFDRIGRFGTPTLGVVVTAGAMVLAILLLDVERLASLGSAFLLLLFALLNVSVVIMRESRIASYVPGFRSPGYPWVQLAGVVTTLALLVTLGAFYVGFVGAVVVAGAAWHHWYVKGRVPRRAAVYRLAARLGELHDEGVDQELWAILQERGPSESDSFDELVARAPVLDRRDEADAERLVDQVAAELERILVPPPDDLELRLHEALARPVVPPGSGAAVLDLLVDEGEHSELVLVRARGVTVGGSQRFPGSEADGDGDHGVRALIVLVSPRALLTQHLRLVAQLVTMTEHDTYPDAWVHADDDQGLRETLLRDERFVALTIGDPGPPALMVDRRVRELDLPDGVVIATVRRHGQVVIPDGDTLLREGDRLTAVGTPAAVARLRPAPDGATDPADGRGPQDPADG